MKSIKRTLHILLLLLTLTMVVPAGISLPGQPTKVSAAAKINKKTLTLLKGQSATLKVTGTNKKTIWTSNRKSVATVSSKGKVIAKQKGTTIITAKIGSKKYSCKVTVQAPTISKSKITMKKGSSTVLKLNGTNQKITWKSSNKKIATVTSKGKITARKAGTATITATVLNKKFTCKITVRNSSSGSSSNSSVPTSGYVWISRTGSKYHRTSSCSGMNSPKKISINDAKKRGYTPCKKCY